MAESIFLSEDDLARLTGYRQKAKQRDMLKRLAVPFRVNASGDPLVARAAIEGARPTADKPAKGWTPPWAAAPR